MQKIECQICKQEFSKITNTHLIKHGLTVIEYQAMGYETVTVEYRQAMVASTKIYQANLSPEQRTIQNANSQSLEANLKRSETLKTYLASLTEEERQQRIYHPYSEETEKKKTDTRKSNFESLPKEVQEAKKQAQAEKASKATTGRKNPWSAGENSSMKRPEIKAKVAATRLETIKNMSDDEYKDYLDRTQAKFRSYAISFENKIIHVRSSYERDFIQFLITNNVKFLYEKKRFTYIYEGKERIYVPDFYLVDYNLFIEVKNDYGMTNDVTFVKRDCLINKGLNYEFVLKSDLNDLDFWKAKVLSKYESHANQQPSLV